LEPLVWLKERDHDIFIMPQQQCFYLQLFLPTLSRGLFK
jgi:hypothetical protein